MDKTKEAICRAALAKYGPMNQRLKAIEELSEFIRALARNEIPNIIEEMADVRIMLAQMEISYNMRDQVREQEWIKLTRLKERMDG